MVGSLRAMVGVVSGLARSRFTTAITDWSAEGSSRPTKRDNAVCSPLVTERLSAAEIDGGNWRRSPTPGEFEAGTARSSPVGSDSAVSRSKDSSAVGDGDTPGTNTAPTEMVRATMPIPTALAGERTASVRSLRSTLQPTSSASSLPDRPDTTNGSVYARLAPTSHQPYCRLVTMRTRLSDSF